MKHLKLKSKVKNIKFFINFNNLLVKQDENKPDKICLSYIFDGKPPDMKENNATAAWKAICFRAGYEPKISDRPLQILRVFVGLEPTLLNLFP